MKKHFVLEYHNISEYDNGSIPYNESICESKSYGVINYQQLGFLVFCFLENFVLLIATILDRERIKRYGCVYICIVSNICMNIILAFLPAMLQLRNSVYPKYVPATTGRMTAMKGIQAAMISSSVTMMFALCGNIFAIIFVRMDGGMLIATGLAGSSLRRQELWYKKTKKRVANGLVAYAWIMPSFMSILAASFMNCLKDCRCEILKVVGSSCPNKAPCSKVYEGLKMEYTILASTVWLLQVVLLITFVGYAIHRQRKGSKAFGRHVTPTENRADETRSTNHVHDCRSNTAEEGGSSISSTMSSQAVFPVTNKTVKSNRLSSNITHSLIMLTMYVICSIPAALPSFIEPFNYGKMNPYRWHLISGITIFLYAVISPIIMLIYIPALVAALRAFFDKIKRFFCRLI